MTEPGTTAQVQPMSSEEAMDIVLAESEGEDPRATDAEVRRALAIVVMLVVMQPPKALVKEAPE